MTRIPGTRLTVSVLTVLFTVVVLPSLASLGTVSDLFLSGRYEEARQELSQGGEGARIGEEVLWRAQLAMTPDEALALLEASRQDDRLPAFVRQRLHLEMGRIQFARGEYRTCLTLLGPLLDGESTSLPGELFLLTGLSYRMLGDLQSAREMLASVRPGDPGFLAARFHLGNISLQMNDPVLARRYFASGDPLGEATPQPALLAGMYLSHRAAEEEDQAAAAFSRLQAGHPSSLPLLELNRILREADEELLSHAESGPEPEVIVTTPEDYSGRFSLQLGSFNDRSLALRFVKRFQSQLPDLRIDQTLDEHGQFLYNIRTGSFVNPALARTEAARLRRDLSIDVQVTDLSDGAPLSE
jgi:tetratricopeptide (TPR) repeat protein|nr:SPOR domain-containing protein [Candidatus Krumholzibacteria bacterium]